MWPQLYLFRIILWHALSAVITHQLLVIFSSKKKKKTTPCHLNPYGLFLKKEEAYGLKFANTNVKHNLVYTNNNTKIIYNVLYHVVCIC